jgi:hypothetical protein
MAAEKERSLSQVLWYSRSESTRGARGDHRLVSTLENRVLPSTLRLDCDGTASPGSRFAPQLCAVVTRVLQISSAATVAIC